MRDYRNEWMQKAKIDYFAPFISLWLACNSWYRSHYSDITSNQDRAFIDKLKTDFTGRNHLFIRFKEFIDSGEPRKRLSFRNNLELLHYALERASLKPERLIHNCSFSALLIDYNNKDNATGYISIVLRPRINADGSVHATDAPNVTLLDRIYIMNDYEKVFTGLFELIYQIRNLVIHGHIKPERDEHEVVKCCFLLLSDLMDLE